MIKLTYQISCVTNRIWPETLTASPPTCQTFDQIAYTIAMEGATDAQQARVLAGHRAHDLIDSYVACNPEPWRQSDTRIYDLD